MSVGFFVNLVGNVLLAKILNSPDLLGVWRSVLLYLQYAPFLNLGASHGLDRVGATMVSRGQMVRYRRAMGASLGFSLVLPLIASLALLGSLPFIENAQVRVGAITLMFLIPVQQLFTFGDLALIFEKKYGMRALVSFASTMIRIPLTLLFAWKFSLAGALFAFGISTVCIAIYVLWKSAMGFELALHGRFATSMILTGLPITLLALGELVIQTVDKWMVLHFLKDTGMGLYTMAFLPLPLLMLLPASLRDAMNVEIYDHARRAGRSEEVRSLYSHTLQMVALISPVVMGMIFFGVPWLIAWQLPKFMASIPAVKLHAVVIYPLLISQTGLGVLVAARLELKSFAVMMTLALCAAFSTWLMASRPGFGLTMVLKIHGAMWLLYGVFILTLNHWKFGLRPANAFGRSLVYMLPMFGAGVALYGVEWIMNRSPLTPETFPSAAISGLLYMIVCAPGLYYLEKRYKSISGFLNAALRRIPGMGR